MVHIDLFQLIQVKVDVCFTQESMRGKSNEGVFVVVSVVCLFVSGLKTACLPEQMLSAVIKEDPREATCRHCEKLLCEAIACPSPLEKHR